MGFGHGMGWGMGFGWIVPLLILGGIFWFLAGRSGERKTGNRDAEEILKERFAKGEIDEEEYRRRKALLKE